MNEGFWADRSGKLYQFNGTHINYIMDNPATFGWEDAAALRAVFKKHGEKFGWEGKARREIMVKAMQAGWVRIRNNGNRGWFIEYAAGATNRSAIRRAVHALVDGGFASYDESIKVTPISISSTGETQGRPEEYHVDQETKEGGVAQFLAAAISKADLRSDDLVISAAMDFSENDLSMHRFTEELKAKGYLVYSCTGHRSLTGPVIRVVMEVESGYLRQSFWATPNKPLSPLGSGSLL